MKDNNFSFIKLRDEITTKSGLGSSVSSKEPQKKLKFEPNLNVTRHHIHTENVEINNIQKQEILIQEQPANVVNINESNF